MTEFQFFAGDGLKDCDALHADGIEDQAAPFYLFIEEGAGSGFKRGLEACHGGAGGLLMGFNGGFGLIDQFGVANFADAAVFGAPGEEVFEKGDMGGGGGFHGVCGDEGDGLDVVDVGGVHSGGADCDFILQNNI